jgi:chemotaxis methyl-accepting protein methylase
MENILEKIYQERGFDFREYRESTLTRRLGRRLRARGAETYAHYACILDKDPGEYNKLFNDLTINVTSFFRDQAAFKVLEESVIPALARKKARDIRICSAGCASGEEPYSIAILLMEMLGSEISTRDITILGTDIDIQVLKRAREGIFTPKEVQGILPAWLDKYFVFENKSFHVKPALGQIITFEEHNLVSDFPYRDMDLVVCRNVLIYFLPQLQTRVLKSFHKGLRKDGFLMLGKSEVPVGQAKGLFHCVDSKAKLYRKN